MTNAANNTFGIEIETRCPATCNIVIGRYYSAGVQVPFLPTGWTCKSDSSISVNRAAGERDCEIVSPVLRGVEGMRQVVQVVAALKERGFKINASCGIHVHVGFACGVGSKEFKKLTNFVACYEKAIYASTGTKSRERQQWCNSIKQYNDAKTALESTSNSRYHLLNIVPLVQGVRPTVEFRAFAGSLNIDKITGHIRMCLAIVEHATSKTKSASWNMRAKLDDSKVGQATLSKLFYALGWTKGRTKKVFGEVVADDLPSIKTNKSILNKMAKKYDAAV